MKTASPRFAPLLIGPVRTRGTWVPVMMSSREGGESHLRIEGAFDALTVSDIEPAIEAMVAARPRRVTVALDRVSLMDSRGVGVILSLRKRIKAQGGTVHLVGAQGQPLTVLKLFKLDADGT